MKFEFSREVCEKYSSIEVKENSCSGSRVAACGQTDIKLIVNFRNFASSRNVRKDRHTPSNTRQRLSTDRAVCRADAL